MSDDKIVDLNKFKRAARHKAEDQTMDKVWRGLTDLWLSYEEEVRHQPASKNELRLSDDPAAVFSVLVEYLVRIAKATELENEEILNMLLTLAIIECQPKGRLWQLLTKASNLLDYGDEDAWENMLRTMHAEGRLTDEQLAHELEG